MKLICSDDDLRTSVVEVPDEEIVRRRIDPFHLDLCDPAPIIDSKGRRFSRLRDVSFVYWMDDDRFCIGMSDAGGETCVVADNIIRDRERQFYHFPDVRPSERGFWSHFAEFAGNPGKHGYPLPARFTEMFGSDICYPDDRSQSLDRLYPGTFCGDMYTEIATPVTLSPHINWVVETFEECGVMVVGKSIRDSLLGKPVTKVEFYLARNGAATVQRLIKNSFLWSEDRYAFDSNGCRFIAKPSTQWDEPFDGSFQAKQSADGAYSIHPNEVRAPRITMHDVINGWSRSVHRFDYFDFFSSSRTDELRSEGIKILKLDGAEEPEEDTD